jgi:hypothetical protein
MKRDQGALLDEIRKTRKYDNPRLVLSNPDAERAERRESHFEVDGGPTSIGHSVICVFFVILHSCFFIC